MEPDMVHEMTRPKKEEEGEVDEELPTYSNSIAIEGIFHKKHEIEDTTKKAQDRRWRTVSASLVGTALHIHAVKKDWGWGRARDGPCVSPDSPPWMRRGELERTYSLLHADAGIAADYKKRRYVIRIRAETDQFLLSCLELSTFIKWLEHLFAAIDVAAPIEDREFPRDMSIPRVQRVRWFRSHHHSNADSPRQQQPARRRSSRNTTMSSAEGGENPTTGKWEPQHAWTPAHDLLYAKLCYSNLLFASPRRSNYVVKGGKQWFVDWRTGRMLRVFPPAYAEADVFFGPWQVIHTENRRI